KSGFKSREQLKAVAEGKLAMADSFAGALGDEDPIFLLSSLPFVAANSAEARRLYDLAKPRYEAVLKDFNQKLLYSTPWPASGVGGAGRKLWEYLPHFTEINYAMPLSLTTVNLGAWNALDAAMQKAVLEAAAETEARQWQALDGRLAKNYERMRENGMTITREVSPALAAKFKTAAQAAIAEWEAKSGAEGREILERFRTK